MDTGEVLLQGTVPRGLHAKRNSSCLVTVLHRPWADGAGQTGQDFLRGREEATEKDDSKQLQHRHLQKTPLLARETLG